MLVVSHQSLTYMYNTMQTGHKHYFWGLLVLKTSHFLKFLYCYWSQQQQSLTLSLFLFSFLSSIKTLFLLICFTSINIGSCRDWNSSLEVRIRQWGCSWKRYTWKPYEIKIGSQWPMNHCLYGLIMLTFLITLLCILMCIRCVCVHTQVHLKKCEYRTTFFFLYFKKWNFHIF